MQTPLCRDWLENFCSEATTQSIFPIGSNCLESQWDYSATWILRSRQAEAMFEHGIEDHQ